MIDKTYRFEKHSYELTPDYKIKPNTDLLIINSYMLSGSGFAPVELTGLIKLYWVNWSLPGQNDRHFADNVFKSSSLNEKFGISIWIFLKFVPKDPTDNKSILVQVMAWRQTGDKPLPGPMLTQFTDAYMRHQWEMSEYSSW